MLGPAPERQAAKACKTAGTTGYFIYSSHSISSHSISIQHRPGESTGITQSLFLDDLVVIARGNTPDPIPNSAVKTLSADGTPS